MTQHREELPPIQYTALAAALLPMAETLVPVWLPGGRREGHEWKCGSLAGGKGSSCSVNLTTGAWSDFAGDADDSGRDLLSLFAKIHELPMAKAAVQLAREHGLESVAGLVKTAAGKPVQALANPRPAPAPKAPVKEVWSTLRPVPDYAPPPTFKHYDRSPETLMHTAEYRLGNDLYGYVARFRTSDGGKDTLPYTFCKSASDGGTKWHWKQWDEPRPLYLPGFALPNGRTVVLVEGEIKAEVLQQLLDAQAPDIYCVVSWPGGSKVWQKADWAWLAGCTVLLWPDCDAQRELLTKAEREQVKDDEAAKEALQLTKPILPEAKQPGMKAMQGIGALLRDTHGATVSMLPIPKPGEKESGWDCKDAILVDGWTGDQVLAFFGQAQPLPGAGAAEPAAETAAPEKKPRSPVGTESGGGTAPAASQDDADDGLDWLWKFYDGKKRRWDLRRSLVSAALENDPKLKGCVAFNEMTMDAQVRKPWPWEHGHAGDVGQDSVLLLGRYLNDVYGVGDVSTQNIEHGLASTAYLMRFHPVREWLDGLTWDGVPRLNKWLMHVLGETPDTLSAPMVEYMTLVGRYWVMGMVWRVMKPGCKFDYCPVLEGKGGLRKSTMVEVLAVNPDWYSDTKFDLSRGKEAYEQVRGKWVYELGELSSFSRSDVNDIKAFVSSKVDTYRVSYGDKAQPFPRQCVLVGSTNDKRYLRDRTGNRRFWPVPVRHVIKTEWLERMRGQLMAEAYALFKGGEQRYTPTEEEEGRLFVPMQESRLQESAVDGELFKLLTREPSLQAEHINVDAERVPVNWLIKALGVDIGKATSVLKGQVEAWLESNGWEFKGRQRVGGALESGVYFRPAVWPPAVEVEAASWTRQDEDRSAQKPADLPVEVVTQTSAPAQWDGGDEAF